MSVYQGLYCELLRGAFQFKSSGTWLIYIVLLRHAFYVHRRQAHVHVYAYLTRGGCSWSLRTPRERPALVAGHGSARLPCFIIHGTGKGASEKLPVPPGGEGKEIHLWVSDSINTSQVFFFFFYCFFCFFLIC